jgi:hypothetical protein
MTLNELMLAQQIETMRRRNLEWIQFEPRLRVGAPPRRPGGIRHLLATALVRLGVLLDGTAAEIATRVSKKEARHAL